MNLGSAGNLYSESQMSRTKKKVSSRSRLNQKVEKSSAKEKAKSYTLDLRIHSPESLGLKDLQGIDTAPALVRLARVKGLDMIAVTDFYSGAFIDRVVTAAVGSSVTVIPGVVIRCAIEGCNDVILACLFPEVVNSEGIKQFLTSINIPQSAYGKEEHLVAKPLTYILERLESFGGIAIPTRMDKTPYRRNAISTLIKKYGFRAFDLAYADSTEFFKNNWPDISFQLFSFSNAQALAQVGSKNSTVMLPFPGFSGLKEVASRVSS